MTAVTVARLLRQAGYRLQGNAKTVEGKQHPDRDPVPVHPRAGAGVPGGRPPGHLGGSEKKEPAGNFANGGVEWEPAGDPRKVNVHDFADKQLGKAVPYGVSDVTASTGWVTVGTGAGTGQFAVESIRRWCNTVGEPAYPHARRLLITADSGGSNGSRPRLWKTGLAVFAGQAGLEIQRAAPAAGNVEMEPDRAPAVLPCLDELARPATGVPRGHHRDHQRRHHQHRAESPGTAGHRHLPGASRSRTRQ